VASSGVFKENICYETSKVTLKTYENIYKFNIILLVTFDFMTLLVTLLITVLKRR